MNFDLLKRLCETPGVSGGEDPIRKLAAAEMRPFVDTLSIDAMGSVIGIQEGKPGGPRVMIAAHIDEIGFRVRHIDDKGFVWIAPVGGWDTRNLVMQRVFVHGFAGQSLRGALTPTSKPRHLIQGDEGSKVGKIEEFYVDLGLPGDDVKGLVEVGDMVTMDRTTEQIGDMVLSKTLDDRLGVFIMIEALRKLQGKDITATVLAVATTQEEVGLRGAIPAAYALNPDIGVAVDITVAYDVPGTSEADRITSLGAGVAIKISDTSLISHPKLVRHFRDIAQAQGISHQLEMLPYGGTDAGGIQRSRSGVPSITLSIPTRYPHSPNEMAHLDDIQATIDLLAAYLEEAHLGDYKYVLE
ncbi:peptidase M42 [Capsulimonas corticalis]|uniref:Peptidase M42 n=1 Tax=Capsulimonas corticalis TaxID=2219043 RepID=A0A402CVD4_9BACT|nr:M42 family metallopeptidase [Capsulimonas corticalis]BDI30372.1 peptidase M42 [Capsulimonas corticalis]